MSDKQSATPDELVALINERVPAKPWQADALRKSLTKRNFALFLEQGLGKTKVAVDRAFILHKRNRITGVLVVTLKGVHRQWIREQLPNHAPAPWAGVEWPVKNPKKLPSSLLPSDKLKFLSMNIDAISASKHGFDFAEMFIKAHGGRVLIVLDESHTIKNPRSQRTKLMRKIGAQADYRMILTGTPLAKNLEEEWSQLRWLDPTILSIEHVTIFRRQFCVMGGFEGRQIVGHKNVDRFTSLTAPYLFHFRKKDAGIEAKMKDQYHFDLSAQQRLMIRNLKAGIIAQIDSGDIVNVSSAAIAMTKINQVASGFIKLDVDSAPAPLFDNPEDNPRLIALREVLETRDGKVAIWCRFIHDVDTVMKALGAGAVRYDGSTSDKDRATAIDRFNNDADCRFFVSNPRAGGTGLNLQGEDRSAIYYSHIDGPIARWQSEDRIHRLGTIGVVQYTDLVASHSFDKKILKSYESGVALTEMALPDLRRMLEEEDENAPEQE